MATPAHARSHSASWISSGLRSHVDEQVGEEARAGGQPLAHRLVGRAVGNLAAVRRRPEQRQVLTEVQGHPAAVASQRAGADPHHLAGRAQLVHPRRRVGARCGAAGCRAPTPRRAAPAPAAGRAPRAGGRCPAPDGGMAVDALPGRQEAGQLALLGGLDLLAQHGQRRPAQPAQDLGVAPLALGAAGAQLAADQVAGALELAQRRRGVDPVAGAHLGGGERAVGGAVAAQQPRRARRARPPGRRPAGRRAGRRPARRDTARRRRRRSSAPRR